MRLLRCFAVIVVLAMPALVGGQAWGQDDPRNVIKYRQGVMKSLADHMSAIGATVKGEVGYWNQIIVHAIAIDGVNRTIPELFPVGTGPEAGETRARIDIWQSQDRFMEAAQQLRQEAARLVHAAQGGDPQAIGAQFVNVGRACGGCHEHFRAEKK